MLMYMCTYVESKSIYLGIHVCICLCVGIYMHRLIYRYMYMYVSPDIRCYETIGGFVSAVVVVCVCCLTSSLVVTLSSLVVPSPSNIVVSLCNIRISFIINSNP